MAKGQKYLLTDISDGDFQSLCGRVCKEILGSGCNVFSPGRDGGRDGVFHGTANSFPSKNSPWNGKIIIQAKHTITPGSSCSDSDFKTTLEEEKEKVKTLIQNKEIEYYLVFTNRTLSAGKRQELIALFDNMGLKGAHIFGLEDINQHIKMIPSIEEEYGLNTLKYPFHLNAEDIKEIILEFSKNKNIYDPIKQNISDADYDKPEMSYKNKKNVLDEEFFKNHIQKSYPYFVGIDSFLQDPANNEYREIFLNITNEIQSKMATLKENYISFDKILHETYDVIVAANPTLSKNRRFITIFLHYMYCNCYIGYK